MKKIRTLLFVLILLGTSFSISVSIVPAKPTANPVIKIGALGPLSITPGKDMRKGAEFAVNEINDAGGVDVGGTKYDFELYIEDNSGTTGMPDTDKALTGLNKLTVDDEVVAIVGGFRTEVMWGIQANLGTTKTPFLGVGSTAQLISPYYWRIGPSNGSMLAYGLIDLYGFGLIYQGVEKVTIIREDVAWTPPLSKLLKFYLGTYLPYVANATSKAMTFTEDIAVSQEASLDSVTTALETVEDDVDALLPIFSAPVGKYATQGWYTNNMSQFLAGINVECQSSTYFEETEGAAYGEITMEPTPPDLDLTTITSDFRDGFEVEFDEKPTYTATFSYDAVYIIKEAIESVDSFTRADIQSALADTDYTGAAWRYKFTKEPGPQLILADFFPNGTAVYAAVPGVNASYGDIIVHDLYSPTTVGYRGKPYSSTYFTQWQQGGIRRTVWGVPATITEDATAWATNQSTLEWPINHAEHGYKPKSAPGFEFSLLILVLSSLIAIDRSRKRK